MGVSEKIAALNHERFMNWQPDFSLETPNSQYWHLKAMFTPVFRPTPSVKTSWPSHKTPAHSLWALRAAQALDLMRPYRLEMGLPLKFRRKNLYEFWGSKSLRH